MLKGLSSAPKGPLNSAQQLPPQFFSLVLPHPSVSLCSVDLKMMCDICKRVCPLMSTISTKCEAPKGRQCDANDAGNLNVHHLASVSLSSRVLS